MDQRFPSDSFLTSCHCQENDRQLWEISKNQYEVKNRPMWKFTRRTSVIFFDVSASEIIGISSPYFFIKGKTIWIMTYVIVIKNQLLSKQQSTYFIIHLTKTNQCTIMCTPWICRRCIGENSIEEINYTLLETIGCSGIFSFRRMDVFVG